MTLVEVAVAMFLAAFLFLAVGATAQSASSTFRTGSAEDDLSARAHRTLAFVSRRLLEAGSGNVMPAAAPPLGSSTLTFRRCEGWAGGIVWGDEEAFEFDYAPGEIDDGLDNNGNGLIDEGVVVWIQRPGQPDEVRSIRGRGVRELLDGETPNLADDNDNGLEDEGGLSFELQGSVLTIRLTLQDVDHQRRLLTKTVETSVRIRN